MNATYFALQVLELAVRGWHVARKLFLVALTRVLIFAFATFIGMLGPVLLLPHLYLGSESIAASLDRMATYLNTKSEFPEVILALFPVIALCFTDFGLHVIRKEYQFDKRPTLYLSLFAALGFLLIMFAVLIASFVTLPRLSDTTVAFPTRWYADFAVAWGMVRYAFVGAFAFELGLALAEARAT